MTKLNASTFEQDDYKVYYIPQHKDKNTPRKVNLKYNLTLHNLFVFLQHRIYFSEAHCFVSSKFSKPHSPYYNKCSVAEELWGINILL